MVDFNTLMYAGEWWWQHSHDWVHTNYTTLQYGYTDRIVDQSQAS